MSSTRGIVAIAVAIAVAAAIISTLTGGTSDSRTTRTGALQTAEGVITAATETALTLRLGDGSTRQFVIEPADAKAVNVPHAQAHASTGLKTRVHFEMRDGRALARRIEDVLAKGGGGASHDAATAVPKPPSTDPLWLPPKSTKPAPVSPAKPMSAAQFAQVRKGMTRDAVRKIAGVSYGEEKEDVDGRSVSCQHWLPAGGDGMSLFKVCYDPHHVRVVKKMRSSRPPAPAS